MEKPIGGRQIFQHTIKEEVVISGAGIHSGESVTMRLKPSQPNTGIVFQRIDLTGKPTVKADVDNVIETNRSTTIEQNGARISTIEHLMASLVGMQVDNVLIEMDGEEVPILDAITDSNSCFNKCKGINYYIVPDFSSRVNMS